MADSYKTFYQGQLPGTVGTLATVPGGRQWIVKHIVVANPTAGPVTFCLYKNGTTGPYQWTPSTMTVIAFGSAEWDGTEALDTAEYFAGVAGSAGSLSVTISGDEVF